MATKASVSVHVRLSECGLWRTVWRVDANGTCSSGSQPSIRASKQRLFFFFFFPFSVFHNMLNQRPVKWFDLLTEEAWLPRSLPVHLLPCCHEQTWFQHFSTVSAFLRIQMINSSWILGPDLTSVFSISSRATTNFHYRSSAGYFLNSLIVWSFFSDQGPKPKDTTCYNEVYTYCWTFNEFEKKNSLHMSLYYLT